MCKFQHLLNNALTYVIYGPWLHLGQTAHGHAKTRVIPDVGALVCDERRECYNGVRVPPDRRTSFREIELDSKRIADTDDLFPQVVNAPIDLAENVSVHLATAVSRDYSG